MREPQIKIADAGDAGNSGTLGARMSSYLDLPAFSCAPISAGPLVNTLCLY
ncbi:MAG TPA: hypothetical protein VLZ81_13730 [Blastocatellia bacterium]|nr:hypothetical protein [Blastocatellia bacterium]